MPGAIRKICFTNQLIRNLLRITGLVLPFLFVVNASHAAESACAVVKIEIAQELTLERQAFDAVMKISNGLDTLAIENVSVNVTFADEAGNPVLATSDPDNTDAKFFIRIDSMDGISDVSGAGTVHPASTAEVHWLIIPAPGSSSGVPGGTLYFVGATLSYTLGGEPEEIKVTPDIIYVKPLPLLNLDYFLTRDIVADDPFTEEIESPEPFVLGVRVKNDGAATATDLSIDSAQPTIVENEQGLPIRFVITGSAVNEQPSSPSLKISLGDIAPNASTMGRWDMETNIAGQFTDFSAEFSHADALGGQLTSIISSVNTHFLEHNVLVDLPGRDAIRDFLANDNGVYRVYESDSVDTVVTDQSAGAGFTQIGSNADQVVYRLSVPQTAGLMYVRVPDTSQGNRIITSVTRSDGKRLVQHNAWHSQKRDRNNNVWLHYLNFFDSNSSGQYTVVLEDAPEEARPPVLQLVPDRSVVEGNPIGFIVEASDPNGDIPAITVSNLPTGATFVDNGDGTAAFDWQTGVGQDGSYAITYTATDNSGLTTSQTATIKVNPTWNTDGDGMADEWEIQYFGDLGRDGTGDYDDDGYTDLQEYQNGTDPTLGPPPVPEGLAGEAGNNAITLSWTDVTEATGYNLYWSTEAGVSKDTATPINAATSPYLHGGLTNKTTYYYVVTSVGPGGESDISQEFSLTAGLRDWQDPQLLDLPDTANLGATRPHVAARADGQAIAVWQQGNGTLTEIWASRYLPDSGWSTAEKISTNTNGDATEARVAMDSSGNAMAVWQQADGTRTDIVAVHYTADVGWSSPTLVEADDSASATQPVIAMLGDGRSVVLWTHGDNTVWSNRYAPAAGWSTAERLDADSVQAVADLQLNIDAFGNILALWSSTADGQLFDVLYNRYLADTGWQGAQVVRGGITGGPVDPQVRVAMGGDAVGNAIAVWNEFDGTRNNVQSSHFSQSSDNWNAPVELDAGDTDARQPQLSMDGEGNALVVWQQSDGTDISIWSNRYTHGGNWAGAALIETTGGSDATRADVVLMREGHAVATWLQSDGVNQSLWANVYKPLNGWQEAQIIETNGLGDVSHSELAGDHTSGDIFGTWQQFDGELNHVVFNRYAIGNEGISNLPPTPVTNGDQSVDEQTTVTLDASGSQDQDGSIATYQWTQVSSDPAGTTVELTGADTATATFTAPVRIDPLQLTFRVVVTDDLGASSEQQVTVTVNPVNTAPLANAGEAQVVNEQTAVTLSGSGVDNDGSITGYSWTQLSGPAVSLTNADQPTAGFTAPTVLVADSPQVMTFRLTVTDNEQANGFADVTVTVNAVNALPAVNAGEDQTVNEQTPVSLGGAATDSDGSITSYAWSQVGGPAVTLSGADSANAGFTAPTVLVPDSPATLTFELTAADNEGGVVSDQLVVNVNAVNALPGADAGGSRAVDEQTAITLQGSGSDSDGSVASYQWTQLSGPSVSLSGAETPTPSFTAPVVLVQDSPTVLGFRLTVTDNEGQSSSNDISVGVLAVNSTPTVNAGDDQTVNEQTAVNLTAVAEDSDGSIAGYEWVQTGGPAVTLTGADTADAGFTAPVVLVQDGPQVLTFDVTVTDNEGAAATDQISVTVEAVNALPSTDAGVDLNVDEVTGVTLSGGAIDSDGTVATYQWTQLSGTAVTLANADTAMANFTAPRLKTAETLGFRLTVTDNEGGVSADDMRVTVNPVNTPPVADAGFAQTVDETLAVTLDGSATTDPDVDGVITAYQWQQVSGPTVTLSGADSVSASFTAPSVYQDTDFGFQLTVSDDEGGSDTATTTVTVVSVNPDDDADGMLDLWEIDYFGTLERDGSGDYDGDGATDLAEHDYGTDPTTAQKPGQPEIVSPDDIEVTELQPALVLTNPDHHPGFPVSYQYEVYRDPALTELVASDIGVGENWIVDLPLADNTWYYWRARANGLILFSEWVSGRFFVNTENDAPGPFQVSYPQDGVWVDSFTPSLSVTNSVDVDEDALTYRFAVYPDNDLNAEPVAQVDNLLPGDNGTTSWDVDVYLQENHWYTWRAIVTDEHGLSTRTADTMIFVNTVNDAPGIPQPVEPGEGSEITVLNPDLVINNSVDPEAEPVQYLFELDTVNTFDSAGKLVSDPIDEGLGTTRWSLDGLQDNTGYYWRVKATDGRAESDWANSRFFVNQFNDAPGAPQPLNPGELAWIGTLQPTLEVYPAVDVDEDALRYEYEAYRANRKGAMEELVAGGVSEQTYWQVPVAFAESGYYYWRARAIDEHDLAGIWSDWVMFYADADGVNDPPRIQLKKLKYEHGDIQAIHKLEKGRDMHDKHHGRNDDKSDHIEIRWKDRDPDSNARISLYYDTDRDGQGGILINNELLEDPDGKQDSYLWDISPLPAGIYYIYAVIDDGTSSDVDVSDNAIIIGDGGGQPFMILKSSEVENKGKKNQRARIEWRDLDSDSNARISLYYDNDNHGYDGTLIVADLPEDPDGRDDKYRWDTSGLEPGEYYIYAVISDGTRQYRVYAGQPVEIKASEHHDDDKSAGKGKKK